MSYAPPKTKNEQEGRTNNLENGNRDLYVKNSEQVDVNTLSEDEVKEVLEELLHQLGYKVHRSNTFGLGYNKLGNPYKFGGIGGHTYRTFLLPRNEELEPIEAKFKEES